MNKFILTAFITLLACQSIEGQLLGVIVNVIKSLWSFSGFTIATSWSNVNIGKVTMTSTVIQMKTTTLLSTIIANPKLGAQASSTSSSISSLSKTCAAMEAQSSSANMTAINSIMSEQTINLVMSSGTKAGYLLLRIQASCTGKTISGTPDSVPGFDLAYPDFQDFRTIGQQAQAVALFSVYLSTEITSYCQQFVDVSKSVNSNCTTCPTVMKCEELTTKWKTIQQQVMIYAFSQETGKVLIKVVDSTTQSSLVEVIKSTNALITDFKECGKCVNTGCTKNQAVKNRVCDRRSNHGSMSSSDRKSYCKKKADSSAGRHKRNVSRARKDRKKKNTQRQKAMITKHKGHWKSVWEQARQMSSNFNVNSKSSSIANVVVKNQMMTYSTYVGQFIAISDLTCEQINQNATDAANNATEAASERVKHAITNFETEKDTFIQQVQTEDVFECLNHADLATDLNYEFFNEVSKCENLTNQANENMFVNISFALTAWVQQINSYSVCHDKCVSRYCPFLPFGLRTSVWICFRLKKIMPRLFDRDTVVESYRQCSTECITQIQISITEISITGQIIMQSNEAAAQESLAVVQECIDSTTAVYQQKLNEIKQAYETCKGSVTTTTQSTTVETTTESTSTSTGTTSTDTTTTSDTTTSSDTTSSTTSDTSSSTTSDTTTSTDTTSTTASTTTTIPPCGTFLKYDPVAAPNDPKNNGFAGGFDLRNETAYVAYGNVSCNNQMPLPGYIPTNPALPYKPGVYISCNSGLLTTENTGFYLVNHPNLAYVPANSTSLWSVQGTLKVNSTSYVFCYGRYMHEGRYLLGKVRNTDASGTSSSMFYITTTGEVQVSTYEVLVCRP